MSEMIEAGIGYHDENAPLNINDRAFDLTNFSNTVRSETSQDIAEATNNSGVANFAYNTTMSNGDNVMTSMGANAASESASFGQCHEAGKWSWNRDRGNCGKECVKAVKHRGCRVDDIEPEKTLGAWKIARNTSEKLGDRATYISNLPAGELIAAKRQLLENAIKKVLGDDMTLDGQSDLLVKAITKEDILTKESETIDYGTGRNC